MMMSQKAPPSRKAALLGGLGLVALCWLTLKDSPVTMAVPEFSAAVTPPRQLAPAAPPLGSVSEKLWLGALSQDAMQRVLSRHTGEQPFFSSASEVSAARSQPQLFTQSRDTARFAQSPLANARRLSDDRMWMDYDMRTLAARVEGDSFLIPLPGHGAVTAEIEAVKLVDGQHRWEGRLLGMDERGTFSITQSWNDQYAVGTLRTVHGDFVLEAKSGLGWVAPSAKEFIHTDAERLAETEHDSE